MPVIDAPDDLSLVPPRRLGVLVGDARVRQHLTIEQVASRSQGRLSVHEVKLLEAGRLAVDDTDVRLLAELLGLPLGHLIPQRTELVIDRTEGRVIAGDSVGRFVPMATADEVAHRYLALVRALRVEGPMDDSLVVPVRSADLNVLAEALFRSEVEVRALLDTCLNDAAAEIRAMSTRSSRRPFMPGLGLLVAFTSMGALLLVPSAGATESGGTGRGEVAVSSSVALRSGVIVRTSSITYQRRPASPSAGTATPPSTTTATTSTAHDPVHRSDVEIGTALVLERDDDGTVQVEER